MHEWFCPIRPIHLIRWKSLNFEKIIAFLKRTLTRMHSSGMYTSGSLTVSRGIWVWGVCPTPLGFRPPPLPRCRPHGCSPVDADPLVMWPVVHAGKPNLPPHCGQREWYTLRLRAVTMLDVLVLFGYMIKHSTKLLANETRGYGN